MFPANLFIDVKVASHKENILNPIALMKPTLRIKGCASNSSELLCGMTQHLDKLQTSCRPDLAFLLVVLQCQSHLTAYFGLPREPLHSLHPPSIACTRSPTHAIHAHTHSPKRMPTLRLVRSQDTCKSPARMQPCLRMHACVQRRRPQRQGALAYRGLSL